MYKDNSITFTISEEEIKETANEMIEEGALEPNFKLNTVLTHLENLA
jgi:hypothetical protein